MGYIDDNLIPGERVLFRARLHWKLFVLPVLLFLTGIALVVLAVNEDVPFGYSLLVFLIPARVLPAGLSHLALF